MRTVIKMPPLKLVFFKNKINFYTFVFVYFECYNKQVTLCTTTVAIARSQNHNN